MNKKSESFYEGLIEFCLTHQIGRFSGLTEYEIAALENKLRLRFPHYLKTYQKYLGQTFQVRNCDIPNATKNSILIAESEARKKSLRQKFKNIIVVDEWYHTEIDEKIDQVCFLNYVDYNGYFSFINLNDESSNIYGYDNEVMIYKWENNLIGSIRKQVLFGLIRTAKQNDSINVQGTILKEFKNDKIIGDRRYVENVRNYNNKVLRIERGKNEFMNLETYLEKYLIERMNGNI